jgi:hypothetical protein
MVREEAPNAPLHSCESTIVTKLHDAWHVEAGLTSIEFPRMHIDHRRVAFSLVLSNGRLHEGGWQLSPVVATGGRPSSTEPAKSG